jgi:prepilin peptidase CpaA
MTTALIPFATGLALAAAHDVRSRRIPNAFCLTSCVVGLGARGMLGGLESGALGAALGLGLLIVPFALGLVGGGDVKLLAATGAWLGPQGILVAALAGLAITGLLAAGIAIAQPQLRRQVTTNLMLSATKGRIAAPSAYQVPMGAALAAGAILAAIFFGGLPNA